MIRVAIDLDEDNVMVIKRAVDPQESLAAVVEALQVAQHEMGTLPRRSAFYLVPTPAGGPA
jgi:hypothetical protein